jgi:oligopeptide transport system substrate-binding protein
VAAAPVRGGVFRLALESPATLDPALTADVYEATVTNQVFSGLLKWDADLNVLPDVAQSWTISHDGRVYTFELRRNARFQNGRQVTAQDFIYSFTRLFNAKEVPPGIIQDYLRKIVGVDGYVAGRADHISGLSAPDPFTLIIRLKKPYASFLSVVCMDQAKVVPREEIERMGAVEFGRHPVGCGPFRLVSWDPEKSMVLAANPDYFGSPAYLDSVVVYHYPSDQGQRQKREFRAGRLETCQIRENEIEDLNRQGAYSIVRRLELSMEFMGMNVQLPPFKDMRVRQAVSMALDREALGRAAGPGFHVPMGLIPPGMPGYAPESKILPEDLARARLLLTQAGYGPKHPLTFPITTSNRSRHAVVRDSVLIASLRRVGIDARLDEVSWSELVTKVDGGQAPAFELTWIADLPDPESFLYTLLASGGGYNIFHYHNEGVDSLLDAGRDEPVVQTRLELYREAERRILQEAPLIPLFNVMTLYAFQPYVHGVEMSPFGICSVPMEKIWLDPAPREGMYAGL